MTGASQVAAAVKLLQLFNPRLQSSNASISFGAAGTSGNIRVVLLAIHAAGIIPDRSRR
jgi:hypothetical protein